MKRKGGIYPHPRGRLAQIQLDKRRYSSVCKTDEEAEAWLEAIQLAHATTVRKEPHVGPKTLASVGVDWLDARETSQAYDHTGKERSVWRHHVAPHTFASRPLAKLKRKHIVEWLDELREKKATQTRRVGGVWVTVDTDRLIDRQTAAHALRVVKGALRYALDRGIIEHDPADGVSLGRWAVGEGDAWAWLTTEEIEAVLALEHVADNGDRTVERRAVYATAIYAGLRKSEIWHLRWERVFFDGDRPRIEVRAPLKSKKARRDVPLFPPVIDALRALRALRGGEDAKGLIWPRDDEGVHGESYDASWSDHPYTKRGVSKVRVGTCTRAGITRDVRFHDLRHTFCSHLAQGTWGRVWSLDEIRDVAGHSSITVTQRYAHLSPEGAHRAAREMRATWGGSSSEFNRDSDGDA